MGLVQPDVKKINSYKIKIYIIAIKFMYIIIKNQIKNLIHSIKKTNKKEIIFTIVLIICIISIISIISFIYFFQNTENKTKEGFWNANSTDAFLQIQKTIIFELQIHLLIIIKLRFYNKINLEIF